MTTFLLTLLLTTAFPSTSQTSWMRPEAFRLTIGMPKLDAVRTLREGGYTAKAGKDANELVIDYSGDKALTLEFRDDRLRSIRFELFAFLPQIRKAFNEERDALRKARGGPRQTSRSIVVYNEALPNVMMVVSDDPNTENGKKGLGFLAVRYYDPRP